MGKTEKQKKASKVKAVNTTRGKGLPCVQAKIMKRYRLGVFYFEAKKNVSKKRRQMTIDECIPFYLPRQNRKDK